jgi:hypothetical protein
VADIGAFSFFISSKPSRARLQRTTFILWLGGIARRVPVRSAVRSHDRKATGGGSRSANWDMTRSAPDRDNLLRIDDRFALGLSAQVRHAKIAHVAERHRRAGWVSLLCHHCP